MKENRTKVIRARLSGKSKTDFALDLVYECDDYTIPAYIKSGLKWLNEQKILE